MPAFADRVKESTATTGTGTLTLDGAATGFQSFTTAFGNGVSVYYVIAGGSEWEIGIGTTGAGTLSRDTVLQSSNADALVPFSAGTKDVFCAYVADRAVTTVDAATLTNKTISGASNTLSNIGNASLTNSAVTVNGVSIALGASGTVADATKLPLTGGTLTGVLTGATNVGNIVPFYFANQAAFPSATTYHGAIAHSHSDGKMFQAHGGVWNALANESGNVATATALQTARNINGVSFNGTADVTVTAAAGTLSGATLASGVTASSLTSVGTLSALTMGGTVSMADNVIGRPRFTDYAETYTTPAISSGTLTLNIENGNVFRVSRNANITTVTISNPAGSGNACSFTLIFDANGSSYTTTWPAAVKWPGGTAPTITTTASRSDMFVFYTNNGGTTWYAMTAAQNFVTT